MPLIADAPFVVGVRDMAYWGDLTAKERPGRGDSHGGAEARLSLRSKRGMCGRSRADSGMAGYLY